jgi:hypothetical protein
MKGMEKIDSKYIFIPILFTRHKSPEKNEVVNVSAFVIKKGKSSKI